MRYTDYLKSDHWRMLRREAFEKYGRICAQCGDLYQLNVHHIRYRNPLTSCTVNDLSVLCRWCHGRMHGIPLPRVNMPKSMRKSEEWRRNMQRSIVAEGARHGNSQFIIFPVGVSKYHGQLDREKSSRCSRTGAPGTVQQTTRGAESNGIRPRPSLARINPTA